MKPIVATTCGALSVLAFSAACFAFSFVLGQLVKAVLP